MGNDSPPIKLEKFPLTLVSNSATGADKMVVLIRIEKFMASWIVKVEEGWILLWYGQGGFMFCICGDFVLG